MYIPREYFLEISREEKERIHRENLKEKIEERKKLNRSYLKGQYGKRLYFDANQLFEETSEELGLEERKLKCIYTKTLRLEKLFAYLKYMNGRRVLLRDVAWHFAVTKQTIQSDLKWLENNGFITTQKNKTAMGKNFSLWQGKTQFDAENNWVNDTLVLKKWLLDRIDWLDGEWV